MKNMELTSRDIWAARLGISSYIISIVIVLLMSSVSIEFDSYDRGSSQMRILEIWSCVSSVLLMGCIFVSTWFNVWTRLLGMAGIILTLSWLPAKFVDAMWLPSWLCVCGIILVAVSFSWVKMSVWPARVVVVGLWSTALSQLLYYILSVDYYDWIRYVNVASVLVVVCGFLIYIIRREGWNKNIHRWFTESLLVLGVVVFIVDLFCATPRGGHTTVWGREGDLPWDVGLILQGTWVFIWCCLLSGFIHSQLRVKKCFDDANVKTKERGPICLAVASGFFYVACVLCVMAFFWALFVDTYKFSGMMVGGLVGNMSLNLFNQLLRIKEVMNVRLYVTCSFLFCGWYTFGLAKLMSLMRENSAKAYSLKGTDDGTSDAQEA